MNGHLTITQIKEERARVDNLQRQIIAIYDAAIFAYRNLFNEEIEMVKKLKKELAK